MIKTLIILLLTSIFSTPASARVFDLSQRTFATYFGGEVGSSMLSKQPWGDASGASTATNESVRMNYAGELGLLMAFSKVNFRFGVEYLAPQHLGDILGTNSNTGVQYFTLDSTTRAIVPKATIEFVVYKGKATSLIFGGSAGYAMVTMENHYTMTAAGAAALSAPSYIEKGQASAVSGEGFVGYEFVFSDNVTLLTTLGYRYLVVGSLKHQNATTVSGGTAVTVGSPVLNNSSQDRTLNLSSANAGLIFRFYF